ncbi:MAG: HEAT repeat domain-containing protein [Isosphaeraceae bacterium]
MRQSLAGWLIAFQLACRAGADTPSPGPLPLPESGWAMELVARAPQIVAPRAIAAAPDGSVFVGQRQGDTPGQKRAASGSIVRLKDGKSVLLATELGPVSGLEWAEDALYVLHGTAISRLRDGDGRAEERIELVGGLDAPDPARPASTSEPVATGMRLGIDGQLYVSVNDHGIWQARGRDGRSIRLQGGGVIRLRRDGTGLEIVSTGQRDPRSLTITALGEIFTAEAPDESGRWPGALIHQIERGHYGYPYQFLTAPWRALPIAGGEFGMPGTQGASCSDDRLPASFRGNLLVCDLRRQSVLRYELRKAGATWAIARQSVLVEKGGLADFHPVAITLDPAGNGFWLADRASDKVAGSSGSGRVFRLSYRGLPRPLTAAQPRGEDPEARVQALDHPILSVRLDSQRILARTGQSAIGPLVRRLSQGGPETGRIHAVWALDAIGDAAARQAVRLGLKDSSWPVRLQSARSCGLRVDRDAYSALAALLADRDAAVRREAAIALGRLGDSRAILPLMAALGDPDRIVAWSISRAVRLLGFPPKEEMLRALLDPRRKERALILADEAWSVPVAAALVEAFKVTPESAVRGRLIATLAGQYHGYPAWTGQWWGPDPLSKPFPRKTQDWAPEGMRVIAGGLRLGLADRDATVRLQAIVGIEEVGPAAAPLVREAIGPESDPRNQAALVEALAKINDPASISLLTTLVVDPARSEPVRAAALDGLARYRAPDVLRARLAVVYDTKTPASLVARALPLLARDGVLPLNDLASFLESPSPLVRSAALLSLSPRKPLPAELLAAVLARLDDASPEVRQAALLAVGALRLRDAIPRLIEIATGNEPEVRTLAIRALCLMPDPRATAIYETAAGGTDPPLQVAGKAALHSLGRTSDPQIAAASNPPREKPSAESLHKFAHTHHGDPRKGEQLFFENATLGCGRCHSAKAEKGGCAGPDLGGLAARRSEDEILTALLEPSAQVAKAHEQVPSLPETLKPLEFTDLFTYLRGLKSAKAATAQNPGPSH